MISSMDKSAFRNFYNYATSTTPRTVVAILGAGVILGAIVIGGASLYGRLAKGGKSLPLPRLGNEPQSKIQQPKSPEPAFLSRRLDENKTAEQLMAECCPLTRELVAKTQPIDNRFTAKYTIEDQRKAHEEAKNFLQTNLEKIGTKIEFVSCEVVLTPNLSDIVIHKDRLNDTVFRRQVTDDVELDIYKAGCRSDDNVIVFAAASHYNGCRGQSLSTNTPGNAVYTNLRIDLLGPNAQNFYSNDLAELLNCGGNIGYNGLVYVLDQETKAEVCHGYFRPSAKKGQKVIQQLRDNGHKIEYPCVESVPRGGSQKVHMVLVAAPASSSDSVEGEDKAEVEFLCALHSFRAQFHQCIQLAERLNKPVVLKATAVGIGYGFLFSNNPATVAKAFYQAAIEYQDRLADKEVKVLFQVFKEYVIYPYETVANYLGLKPED